MNNAANIIRNVIVRLHPVAQQPAVFDADSVHDKLVTVLYGAGDDEREVSLDYYDHTLPVDRSDALKVVEEYAKARNIPADTVFLRTRIPKKARKPQTNDANLQQGDGQPFQRRATDRKSEVVNAGQTVSEGRDELTNTVQALHDSYSEEKNSSSANNESQTTLAEPRKKRAYNKDKAKSAKSRAAMSRYLKEVETAAQKNNVIIESAAVNVSEDKKKEAIMQLAAEIAAVLLKNPGVL